MSDLHGSPIGDFTRGGQVVIHFLRMTGQVIQKFFSIILFLYFIITAVVWWNTTTEYSRYLGVRWIGSAVGVALANGDSFVPIRRSNGSTTQVQIKSLWHSEPMKRNATILAKKWFFAMCYAIGAVVIIFILIILYLRSFGASTRKDRHIRGGQIEEKEEVNALLKDKGINSDITLAGVSIVKDTETQHISLSGSPGTGKTTILYELLSCLRKRGDRVICFSPSGDFIRWFHRDGKDTILNPFDARCPSWSPWNEISYKYHYNMIAAGMIPRNGGDQRDPIWNNAARSLVAVLLEEMHRKNDHSLPKMLEIISTVSMPEIHSYLSKTKVASQLDASNERMGANIRNTASVYLNAFDYVPSTGKEFVIRDWVLNEEDDGWVFLNARSDQIEAVRGVLTTWIEVFTSAVLSMSESKTRRIWFVLDELPKLHEVPSLETFLAEARKFGGCGVISYQQLSQLENRYGENGAKTITGLCATWGTLRQNDPYSAEWIAKGYGETEVLEHRQNLSYGANEIRDGVSLANDKKKREALLPSQIRNLDNFEGYLILPGDLPYAHFRLDKVKQMEVSEEFIPNQETLSVSFAKPKENQVYAEPKEDPFGFDNDPSIDAAVEAMNKVQTAEEHQNKTKKNPLLDD